MPGRQRAVDRGTDRARHLRIEIGREIDRARLERGLGYAVVGRAMGMSGVQVARICRGQVPGVSLERLAQLCAVVGLELAARGYPVGSAIRDHAHVALLERLRVRLAPELRWRLEVPVIELPLAGAVDLRSWDAAIDGFGWTIRVEAETRVSDDQSLIRRVTLKQRDGSIDCVVLLLSDTRHHRELLDAAGDALRTLFPIGPRAALSALAAGRKPPGSCLVLL